MVRTVAPSEAYLALVHSSQADLRQRMLRGETPDAAALAGREFRGTNTPATSRLLGIRRFVKGFLKEPDGSFSGYNRRVKGSDLSTPWTCSPMRGQDRFGFFAVTPVRPEGPDNEVLGALLLDYGARSNPAWDPSRLLRDYLVRAEPGSDDLLIGQAYLAVGQRRVRIGHFVLEPLD
jgi:hypothetical protein